MKPQNERKIGDIKRICFARQPANRPRISPQTPLAMSYNTRSLFTKLKNLSSTHQIIYFPSPPLVSGLGAALLTLPLLLPETEPSSALRSRKPAHRSASDSLLAGGSLKNSVDSEGVLGVRWKGDTGRRKLPLAAPGLASPACSFCSSVQLRSAAIS